MSPECADLGSSHDLCMFRWMLKFVSRSATKHARRLSRKLRTVRTEPKPSRNYDEEPSKPLGSVSTHSNRNQAKRELNFSGRQPKRKESTKKLSSKAKKSLEYPTSGTKSSQKQKSRLSSGKIHRPIHPDPASYSLVDYSMSDNDSMDGEAEPRLSITGSEHSQKKRRRSSRHHQGYFKSMCEADMAADLRSALTKSDRMRDSYAVTSEDDGQIIRLSAGRKKKATKSRIPVLTSNSNRDSKVAKVKSAFSSKQHKPTSRKPSFGRLIESGSSSDDEEHPTVIESTSYKLTSHGERNGRDLPGPSRNFTAPREIDNGGDGPCVGSKHLESWLRSGHYEKGEVAAQYVTHQQVRERRLKGKIISGRAMVMVAHITDRVHHVKRWFPKWGASAHL